MAHRERLGCAGQRSDERIEVAMQPLRASELLIGGDQNRTRECAGRAQELMECLGSLSDQPLGRDAPIKVLSAICGEQNGHAPSLQEFAHVSIHLKSRLAGKQDSVSIAG
jgi:hypothetical protein